MLVKYRQTNSQNPQVKHSIPCSKLQVPARDLASKFKLYSSIFTSGLTHAHINVYKPPHTCTASYIHTHTPSHTIHQKHLLRTFIIKSTNLLNNTFGVPYIYSKIIFLLIVSLANIYLN